jgi:transposase
MMDRWKSTRAFKLEAVRLIKVGGVSASQLALDLGVHATVLQRWVNEFSADPAQLFPGHGQMKADQVEVIRLCREVTKQKAEHDIFKKNRGLICERTAMKFGFVAADRGVWPVGWMCAALGVTQVGIGHQHGNFLIGSECEQQSLIASMRR